MDISRRDVLSSCAASMTPLAGCTSLGGSICSSDVPSSSTNPDQICDFLDPDFVDPTVVSSSPKFEQFIEEDSPLTDIIDVVQIQPPNTVYKIREDANTLCDSDDITFIPYQLGNTNLDQQGEILVRLSGDGTILDIHSRLTEYENNKPQNITLFEEEERASANLEWSSDRELESIEVESSESNGGESSEPDYCQICSDLISILTRWSCSISGSVACSAARYSSLKWIVACGAIFEVICYFVTELGKEISNDICRSL